MEVVLFGGGGGRGCEYSRGDIYLEAGDGSRDIYLMYWGRWRQGM